LVPLAPLAAVRGRTIYLLTVELWTNQVCLRFAGSPTWRESADVGRERSDDDGGPSPLARLDIVVLDDIGTSYRMTSGQTDGTDAEWRADWYYEPGVPADAHKLIVQLGGKAIELPIAS
jgi:hypothetical protein